MQSDPSQAETVEPDACEDEPERVSWANYGETQAVADGDEPTTEPYAA